MRKTGYYKVKKHDCYWEIGRYNIEGDAQFLTSDDNWYNNEDFEQIDENRIPMPDDEIEGPKDNPLVRTIKSSSSSIEISSDHINMLEKNMLD